MNNKTRKITKAPPVGTTYYRPQVNRPTLVDLFTWWGTNQDIRALEQGQCHWDEASARAHSLKMLAAEELYKALVELMNDIEEGGHPRNSMMKGAAARAKADGKEL